MPETPLFGFLNLHKPAGPTSNDMVEEMRRILGTNCGHAGTLDPRAEGVLVLGVGEGRKFIQYLDHRKAYEGVMLLGRESSTLDLEGELTEPRPVTCSPEEAAAAGMAMVGTLELAVPAFSAVHMDGRRLYELAREGRAVEPPLRKCTVDSLEILSMELPRVRFRVACSGGTYIRSLASEWGRRIGCGALLESLVRIRSGAFTIGESLAPEKILGEAGLGRAQELLVPPGRALGHIPAVVFDGESARSLRHGRSTPLRDGIQGVAGGHLLISIAGSGFLGVGRAEKDPAGPGLLVIPERLIAEGMPA